MIGSLQAALVVGMFQNLVDQAHGAESGHVLPLSFFQTVTPDHRRPGFGPRGPPANNLAIRDVSVHRQASDQDKPHSHQFVAHSQPLLSNALGTMSNVLNFSAASETGISARHNFCAVTFFRSRRSCNRLDHSAIRGAQFISSMPQNLQMRRNGRCNNKIRPRAHHPALSALGIQIKIVFFPVGHRVHWYPIMASRETSEFKCDSYQEVNCTRSLNPYGHCKAIFVQLYLITNFS